MVRCDLNAFKPHYRTKVIGTSYHNSCTAAFVPFVRGAQHAEPSAHAYPQGQVRLIGLRESLASRHHRYLLFGFDADQSTSELDIGGTHFQQASIPGLHQDQATLACSPMAGGFMLQITPQVRHGCT
jgi:hypothetical protein